MIDRESYERDHETLAELRTPEWVWEYKDCRLCGSFWAKDDLDENGLCPWCAKEAKP